MSVIGQAPSFPVIPAHMPRLRYLKDRMARRLIAIGGGSVIVAIALIFCYLLYEVLPLFTPAEITLTATEPVAIYRFAASQARQNAQAAVDELGEVLFYSDQHGYQFVRVSNGDIVESKDFPDNTVLKVGSSRIGDLSFANVSESGLVSLSRVSFDVVFPKAGGRQVEPSVKALVDSPLELQMPESSRLLNATFDLADERLAWVGYVELSKRQPQFRGNRLVAVQQWSVTENLFGDGTEVELVETRFLEPPARGIDKLMISPDLRWIYAIEADGAGVSIYDLKSEANAPSHRYSVPGKKITASSVLLGGHSLLLGDVKGKVVQLSKVRHEDNSYQFVVFREFQLSDTAIVYLTPEQRRKGFLALDAAGSVFLANTTAHRVSLKYPLDSADVLPVLDPRSNSLVAIKGNVIDRYEIENEHPEISWKSLWQKVWYEGYSEPKYLWQSSAANNDFEPKLSLVPLSLGTLKAAFYAMLLAMPLAICSAIYTAYFMAPAFRRKVKPTIELMEALPTVILGFLAGLWLAPLMEAYLPGVFLFLVITPLMFLIAAFTLSVVLQENTRLRIPDGWEALALVPVLLVSVAASYYLSNPIQDALFGGDVRKWIEQELGIAFDQRNALVIGFAMGFAVIPTIFSITEDAIFSVPKSLTKSSLALGASTWQTLVRVILPTASPGIFSGVMIGFGRAVGETMIVLMATGNTPVMNFNIFEGFRTLSANIAVELPEAEVHSTHFRVLFLSALVLFVFTFLINTSAEFVRQRLREKYGSL